MPNVCVERLGGVGVNGTERDVALLVARFERVAEDVHLPLLEREFYRLKLIKPLTALGMGSEKVATRGVVGGDDWSKATDLPRVESPSRSATATSSSAAVSRDSSAAGGIVRGTTGSVLPPSPRPLSSGRMINTTLPPIPTAHSPHVGIADGSPSVALSCSETPSSTSRRAEIIETLAATVGLLEKHRAQTVAILALCSKRDQIVANSIFPTIQQYKRKEISTLDLQSKLLTALRAHQQVALEVVEGVSEWREALTRPYPFSFRGKNCFVSILEDCAKIEAEGLSSALPLLLDRFPLNSNMAESLSLFDESNGEELGSRNVSLRLPLSRSPSDSKLGVSATSNHLPRLSSPRGLPRTMLSSSACGRPTVVEISNERRKTLPRSNNLASSMVNRLEAAEKALGMETTLQLQIASEMHDLSSTGRFMPIMKFAFELQAEPGVKRHTKRSAKGHSLFDSDQRCGIPVSALEADTERAQRLLGALQSATESNMKQAEDNFDRLR